MSDKDHGYRALVDRIFTMGKPKVSVGIFETDGGQSRDDGMTVATLATIHEFGLGVPQRSFLRGWFDENLGRAQEALRRLLVSVVEGKRSKEQALELFGLWLQAEIQKRIAGGIPPALASSTIARKGSSTPLIDTGQLRSSITYQVDTGSGGVKQGTSEAATARHAKAKADKVAGKKEERRAAREKRKEARNARRAIVKSVKKSFRGTKKGARRFVKKASRLAKKTLG